MKEAISCQSINQSINIEIYLSIYSLYPYSCPSIHSSLSNHHSPYSLYNPHQFTLVVLQDSVVGRLERGAGVWMKPPPPHLSSTSLPPLPW